ncbi:MAG: ATP-binding cassette domain-containing protein [Novosphingobium sp.]
MAEPALFRLAGVTKTFAPRARNAAPVVALDDVSLSLSPGRVLALVGPDAAGKTTLLRTLAGLVELDRGEAELFGAPVAALDRARIGYMPQGGALYAELTVRQNLELYARLREIEPEAHPERIEHLYRATGLADFRNRAAGALSGGMRQKLALACAVVGAPELMLLDEPSVGVDPVSRREIWNLANELAPEGSAIVWATSNLDDAARCDEVALLHEGRVRFTGSPQGLADQATGRCFVRPLGHENRRMAVRGTLESAAIVTGRIESDALRVVTRAAALPGREWTPTPPRADDGFAALLDDGTPLGPSALAASFPERGKGEVAAIAAVGLTRRYGSFTAAHDISFTVRPGEIFGLLGPNGAGKSTTFRMLCGLLTPSSGRGTVAGRDLLTARAEARQALGYMPQKFSLYADLSLAGNLSFVAGAYGLAGGGADEAIERVVEALGLAPFWRAETGVLPLGIKQRLALAAAVMHCPPVLFLDEPTSGVDPLIRREFWHHINAIAERGVAVLVTTHFMDEAENCDRLLLINQAEAIAQGTPTELRRGVARAGEELTLEQAFIALIELQRGNRAEAA